MEETEIFKKQKQSIPETFKKKQKQSILDEDPIPGIYKDVALLCLSRLSQRDKARCRCVSKSFKKSLSNEDHLNRLCKEQGIPSKQRLVFMCLGKKKESRLTSQNAEFDEEEEEEEIDDCDEDNYLGTSHTGLIWLMLDPFKRKWEVLFDLPLPDSDQPKLFGLPKLATDLRCRSIRLLPGHHPGQVLIHGLITKSDCRNGCEWRQQSQIWSLDLFSMKMFPCVKSRIYRTGFAWANISGHVVVAAGKPYPDTGDYMALFDARMYYGTSFPTHVSQNSASNVTHGSDNSCINHEVNRLYAAGSDNDDDDDEYEYEDEDEEEDEDDEESGFYDRISEISEAREQCAGFTLNEHFYLLGGINEDEDPINSGEYYDANSNSWEMIQDMWPFDDVKGSPPSVGVVNDKLYALKPRTTEIIQYDCLTNSWSKFGNLPKENRPIYEYRLLAVGDELWVFVTDVIERRTSVLSCRPQSGESTVIWKKSFTDLPSGLHILDFVVIEV